MNREIIIRADCQDCIWNLEWETDHAELPADRRFMEETAFEHEAEFDHIVTITTKMLGCGN